MIKVILTAIGCPGGPSIIESLREDQNLYIIGTDMREFMVGRFLVDEYYKIPAGKSDDFIPTMINLVKSTKADVILPLATFELIALSQNKHLFEEIGCKVCVSEYASLLIANDRSLLYSKFDDFGIMPNFRILKNGNQLLQLSKELGFPEEKVVVKPFISHGSIGLRIIDDRIDLFNHYRHNKPNNTSIPMNIAQMIFGTNDYNDIVISEFLPGKEFGVDLLMHPTTHQPICSLVRDNGEVFHSEISDGRIIENQELLDIALQIVSNLKLAYTINIDFKVDKYGKPKVLEINPRLPATSYLAFSAGINLPLNSIYLALGKDVLPKIKTTDCRIFSYRGFAVVDNNGKLKNHSL